MRRYLAHAARDMVCPCHVRGFSIASDALLPIPLIGLGSPFGGAAGSRTAPNFFGMHASYLAGHLRAVCGFLSACDVIFCFFVIICVAAGVVGGGWRVV